MVSAASGYELDEHQALPAVGKNAGLGLVTPEEIGLFLWSISFLFRSQNAGRKSGVLCGGHRQSKTLCSRRSLDVWGTLRFYNVSNVSTDGDPEVTQTAVDAQRAKHCPRGGASSDDTSSRPPYWRLRTRRVTQRRWSWRRSRWNLTGRRRGERSWRREIGGLLCWPREQGLL